jgi:hypothetical protein
MAELTKKGKAGAFPVFTFCIFEVLERCPSQRSGTRLEKCPECPLMPWCHSDRGTHGGVPKAKRSNGHYSIDSAIQKVEALSLRIWESDYLCIRPQAAGVWFTQFDEGQHVTEAADFDPNLPVHASIDIGVETGAVFFQVFHNPYAVRPIVNVFGDYYSYDRGAEGAATDIKGLYEQLTGRPFIPSEDIIVSMDRAGGAKNPVGPTVIAEYVRAGLKNPDGGVHYWPRFPGSVNDSLALVETLLKSATGGISLLVHPRCKPLIDAFQSYVRKKVNDQWLDQPADPQHPHEELIDALRGGVKTVFPRGLSRPAEFHARTHFRNLL